MSAVHKDPGINQGVTPLFGGDAILPKNNPDFSTGFGGGGGGMSGDLERRVAQLEGSVSDVRLDVAIIKERSESLAGKVDLARLVERSEGFVTKADLAAATQKVIDKMDDKQRWRWGNVIIPLIAVVLGGIVTTGGGVIVALLASKTPG